MQTLEAPKLYIPPNCFTLDKSPIEQQIRLGIQGFPNTGKTFAALTFPNPLVANLDRGLGAHAGRSDVVEVQLWNAAFCRTIDPQFHPSKLKDIIVKWLTTEAVKLTESQTLVIDGNTGIQNAYHRWYEVNKALFLTNSGKVNDFAEWTVKKTYYGEVMETLKTLRCNVVFISHEVDQKDKNGPQGPSYSGKIRPLLTGAFGDEIAGHFTDWFRQHCSNKPDPDKVDDKSLALWGMDRKQFKDMLNSFTGNSIYYWQTEGDDIFDAKRSSLVNAPRFIPATYQSFCKYRRK